MAIYSFILSCIAKIISVVKPSKQASRSDAAKFNALVWRKLQKAYEADPEVDFAQILPTKYSNRLADRRRDAEDTLMKLADDITLPSTSITTPPLPASLRPIGDFQVIFPLSSSVLDQYAISCASDLADMLKAGEIIWSYCETYVVKCGSDFVVKIKGQDTTEYSSMMFLEQCGSVIPTPKPLGMVTVGGYTYLFMSYVEGESLDKVWPGLDKEHKDFLQSQLNVMLGKLRGLSRPEGNPLGGVLREGCKDSRRTTRTNQTSIHNAAEFEDFVFSNPVFGSQVWISFLRQMLPRKTMPDVVFSHGDLRPANIMVALDRSGSYKICGIIDWERSGFYPDYWDFIKATNTMSPMDESDWFLYLPERIRPEGSDRRWLIDRIWDKHVA